MNTKHLTVITRALVLGLLLARPLAAQPRVPRPPEWPAASTIVRQFLEGKEGIPITAALVRCPSENPYGDSVWVALLAREPTPYLLGQLGATWTQPLLTCNDPRIERWYRQRLRESRDVTGAGPVLTGLIESRTPENRAFLKQVAFEEWRDDELRSEILRRLSYRSPWEERLDIYLETYARTQRMPDPFAYNAFHELAGSPVAGRLVTRALAAAEEHPRNPNTVRLLAYLAAEASVLERPELRARVRHTLLRIEANRDGRYPRELVAVARERRQQLDRMPSRR